MKRPETKTVLVVEDEPDVRMFVEAALEDAGFKVITATNGHEAYNCVKQQRPDFITLDLVMPEQSGALFYLKLQKNRNWCDIPVMILSAHARDELGEEDFKRLMKGQEAQPPEHFMEKPVEPLKLVRMVAEALGVEVETDAYAAGTRDEVLSQLKGADLETLMKVKSLLKKTPE